MFVLVVVVLILVCAIIFDGVSSLIVTLFSSGTTLLIPYNSDVNYNGLLVVLGIKPGACGLGGCGFGACSLSA